MPYSIHIARMPCLSEICPVDSFCTICLILPDLVVEIFFKKEEATEKGKVDFEIGD